jgi:hypothetical protein
MRGSTAKRINTSMKNAEATTATEVAAVAERGAHVAPEKAASKKAASQDKGAPKGQKTAMDSKPKASGPKKKAPVAKKATKPARTKASAPRAETKGASIRHSDGYAVTNFARLGVYVVSAGKR